MEKVCSIIFPITGSKTIKWLSSNGFPMKVTHQPIIFQRYVLISVLFLFFDASYFFHFIINSSLLVCALRTRIRYVGSYLLLTVMHSRRIYISASLPAVIPRWLLVNCNLVALHIESEKLPTHQTWVVRAPTYEMPVCVWRKIVSYLLVKLYYNNLYFYCFRNIIFQWGKI